MSPITRRLVPAAVCAAFVFALWPAEAVAQRRGVRRVAVRSTIFFGSPFYYPGYFFYDPFYWGWYGQYPIGPYPPYGRPIIYDNTGSARLQVMPRNAEVYIDGYFVGTADDYDGLLQRLHVPVGQHDLELYLEGYRPWTQKVLFRPGTTLKITHTMEPLPPGQANEERPKPDPNARPQERRPGPPPGPGRQGDRSNFGTLSIRVQPPDAAVSIDGEQWDGPQQGGRLLIDVADGPHRVEVRKDGFRTYSRTVQVRRGETLTLNISLSQQ